MAMIDIVIPEGDPQQGTLEIGTGTLNPPKDILSDITGIEEIVLPTTGYGGG
jgi:hypothetical protein